jgi:hypothetical protein
MDPEVVVARPRGSEVDPHVFRAGVLAGVLAFIAFVGVFKDVYALIDPGRRGSLAWGFLMVRYTSLERVWFGYRLHGDAAWYATLPHVAIYAAAIIGLAGMRRWGWWLVFLYVIYVSLSEWSFMFFYPLGYLTGEPYPAAWANEEWKFLVVSTPLELTAAAALWWYRDVFVRRHDSRR